MLVNGLPCNSLGGVDSEALQDKINRLLADWNGGWEHWWPFLDFLENFEVVKAIVGIVAKQKLVVDHTY